MQKTYSIDNEGTLRIFFDNICVAIASNCGTLEEAEIKEILGEDAEEYKCVN